MAMESISCSEGCYGLFLSLVLAGFPAEGGSDPRRGGPVQRQRQSIRWHGSFAQDGQHARRLVPEVGSTKSLEINNQQTSKKNMYMVTVFLSLLLFSFFFFSWNLVWWEFCISKSQLEFFIIIIILLFLIYFYFFIIIIIIIKCFIQKCLERFEKLSMWHERLIRDSINARLIFQICSQIFLGFSIILHRFSIC